MVDILEMRQKLSLAQWADSVTEKPKAELLQEFGIICKKLLKIQGISAILFIA